MYMFSTELIVKKTAKGSISKKNLMYGTVTGEMEMSKRTKVHPTK